MILKTAFASLALLLAILIAPFAHATETPVTPTIPTIEAPKVDKPSAPKPHPLFNPAGDLKRLQGGAVKSAPELVDNDDENEDVRPEDLLTDNQPIPVVETSEVEAAPEDEFDDILFYDMLGDSENKPSRERKPNN